MLALFDTRYRDFTAKHLHEKLVADHGCTRSYNWVRLTLQARGRMRAAPRRGAHRRKRRLLQLPADRHRRHYVKATVRVHEHPDDTLALFHGPHCLARYRADGEPIDTPTRKAA